MTIGIDLLFLDQKISVLQATDDFAFQLKMARKNFNYLEVVKTQGRKAFGTKVFYDWSDNLIRWIYIHSAFQKALKQHEISGYRKQLGQRPGTLSASFLELQLRASSLLADSLKKLEKDGVEITLNQSSYNAGHAHHLGIDILYEITSAKSEQDRIDLYDRGFKSRPH